MTQKKRTHSTADKPAKSDDVLARADEAAATRKQLDPLNEKVRSESEEAAMVQDQIRKGRTGPARGERREELASMQPKAVTEPDMKGA